MSDLPASIASGINAVVQEAGLRAAESVTPEALAPDAVQPDQTISFDPTDPNHVLAEELAASQGQVPNDGQPSPEAAAKPDLSPAAEPVPSPAAQPQIDPALAYLAQQNQMLQLQMQAQQAQMAKMLESFQASLPKPEVKPKTDIELFQEQTLSKAEEALLQKHLAPIRGELDQMKQAAHQAKVAQIATQRMNEALSEGRNVFQADLEADPSASAAVQELVLTMMYGYEKPAKEAAQIANQVVEKILAARTKRLTAKAKADALAKPRAPAVAGAQTVTAGGTGGVPGARPDWFFKG